MSSEIRWTGEQADAITAAGHTLLAAGAGTGKTTTLIGKILWHLGLGSGIDERTGKPLPECPAELLCQLPEIVAITFTEKAAYDLKRKLRQAIEQRAPELLWELDRAYVGTIHGFCGQLLREHALRFGIDPGFGILDERETQVELMALIRDLLLRRLSEGDARAEDLVGDTSSIDGYTHQNGPVDLLAAMLRDLRWHGDRYYRRAGGQAGGRADSAAGAGSPIDLQELKRVAGCWDEKDDELLARVERLRSLAAEALGEWHAWLEEENVRDFDAMVLDCRDRLASEAGRPALESIRSRIRLLVIDEFQDTDGAQRDIAFLLGGLAGARLVASHGSLVASPPHTTPKLPTLFLVGDPKQSIYGFRGADIAVWNRVKERLAEFGPPLELTGNFRSDPAVIGFANRASSHAIDTTGAAVEAAGLTSRVGYTPLAPRRRAEGTGAVEWLVAKGRLAEERQEAEAEAVAARIRHLVIDRERGDHEGVQVVDPETGRLRDCQYRDVAVLFRTRGGVDCLAQALAKYGVPFYLAGDAGLTNRLEIADLLNLFRLIANPLDDLAAMAWLRSPFVALRDEVITRIRLANVGRPLLYQAREWLEQSEWFPAPEHARVHAVEQDALRSGLELLDELIKLRSRVPIDQLAHLALERSGYPLHLLLLPQPEPKLANLTRFIRILEGYRNQTLGTFLEMWGRWEDQDLGVPQAPLYSKRDNVVTLSTIHAAKGLEWPVVFLAGVDGAMTDKLSGEVWSDRDLGPVLGINKDDRGVRAVKLCQRRLAEERAEEARIIYVAATRARDRLIIAAPAQADLKDKGRWLWAGVDPTVQVRPEVYEVERPPLPPEPELAWLDDIAGGAIDGALVGAVRRPAIRYFRSATEMMKLRQSRKDWRLMYENGVSPVYMFAPDGPGDGLAPRVRGTIIHGVLEKIEDEAELAELLDVAVGSLDSPELVERLARGTEEREAIEQEIKKVVTSEEWRWYVEGRHWRELKFVQLRTPQKWRIGAFDLYRPGEPEGLIVDFKTQDVSARSVETEARKYALQSLMYRTVAGRLAGPAKLQFHFTGPNVVVPD
jgi:ATP-dependent helicase/nuclease subunit A